MKRSTDRRCAANEADFRPVCICFLDDRITGLFAELVAGRGVPVAVVDSFDTLDPEVRIITEPHFLPDVRPDQYGRCLVIGEVRGAPYEEVASLPRPLTEERIEQALDHLLSPAPRA